MLVREIVIAYGVLIVFLLAGEPLLRFPGTRARSRGHCRRYRPLIALRMIFPGPGTWSGEPFHGEPFVVPLAIPLVAGPSTLATLLLLQSTATSGVGWLMLAVTIAGAVSAVILLSSTFCTESSGNAA